MSPADGAAGGPAPADSGAPPAGGGAAPGGSGPAQANGGPDKGAGTAEPATTAKQPGPSELNPHKVPDKFLDEGRPNYARLTAAYADAEKALMRKGTEVRAEVERQFLEGRAKAAPATPGDYKVEDKFILGDREVIMKTDDPMLGFVKQVAHANQWTQQQFDQNVRGWISAQMANLPKWTDEAAKLGTNADARHNRVNGFLRGNLSEQSYAHFARMPATASLITAIEEVMELAGHPKITDDTTVVPNETLNAQQLREMQSDPRYTGEKGKQIDPSFVARVRAGYRALAKNGQGR